MPTPLYVFVGFVLGIPLLLAIFDGVDSRRLTLIMIAYVTIGTPVAAMLLFPRTKLEPHVQLTPRDIRHLKATYNSSVSLSNAERQLIFSSADRIYEAMKADYMSDTTPRYSVALKQVKVPNRVCTEVRYFRRVEYNPFVRFRDECAAFVKQREDNNFKPADDHQRDVLWFRLVFVTVIGGCAVLFGMVVFIGETELFDVTFPDDPAESDARSER